MRTLSNLKPKTAKKSRKRVGRGSGSGSGTYSGRGIKGQKSRAGGKLRPGFEGGRMPLIRQIPKARGFKSIHPKAQLVTLSQLENKFADGEHVNPKSLEKKGLINNAKVPVKVLGQGSFSKKLSFKDVRFSASTLVLVEKSGSTVEKPESAKPAKTKNDVKNKS